MQLDTCEPLPIDRQDSQVVQVIGASPVPGRQIDGVWTSHGALVVLDVVLAERRMAISTRDAGWNSNIVVVRGSNR
jgi:hypothetical protein